MAKEIGSVASGKEAVVEEAEVKDSKVAEQVGSVESGEEDAVVESPWSRCSRTASVGGAFLTLSNGAWFS